MTSNDENSTMSKVGKEKQKEEKEKGRALKEKEKAARRAEKERIRVQRESARLEKELKRQQDEAEKVLRKKEREAVEAERELKKKEKEFKRQQDEAEKEQRRKEKEAVEGDREQKRKERETAERKKQLVLQKQATIMDRLFRRKEPKTPSLQQQQPGVTGSSPSSLQKSNASSPAHTHEITAHVDQELRATCDIDAEELLRIHLIGWQEQRMNKSAEPVQRWGVRRAPKVTVFRELLLQGAGTASCRKVTSGAIFRNLKRSRDDFENLENLNLDLEKDDDCIIVTEDTYNDSRRKVCKRHWKLPQFDKSHRPSYYGTFSKKSATMDLVIL